MATKPTRVQHLAAIHIAEKALHLSREDAAALKLQVTGLASSADMNASQRAHYLAHLAVLQAKAAEARGEKPAYQPKRPAEVIRTLIGLPHPVSGENSGARAIRPRNSATSAL